MILIFIALAFANSIDNIISFAISGRFFSNDWLTRSFFYAYITFNFYTVLIVGIIQQIAIIFKLKPIKHIVQKVENKMSSNDLK